MRHRATPKGFTIVEVLVAVGILSFVGVFLFLGVRTMIHGISSADVRQERHYEGRMALDRMRKEISMSFLSLHNNFEEEPRSTSLFIGERDRVVFLSFGHERRLRDAKEADQMVIEYYLGRSPDPERCEDEALLRRIKPYRDDRPEKDGRVQVMACGVKELEFEYWNRNDSKGKWEKEWDVQPEDLEELLKESTVLTAITGKKEAADINEENKLDVQLPWRVRIRLEMNYEDPQTGKDMPISLETQAAIHVRHPLNFSYSGSLKMTPATGGKTGRTNRKSTPGGGGGRGR